MNTKKFLFSLMVLFLLPVISGDARAAARWSGLIGDGVVNYYYGGVSQTPDGGYIMVGHCQASGFSDAWCAKLDVLGNVSWQYRYGYSGEDYFNDVCPLSDGSYFVTGSTKGFGAGSRDVWCLLLGPTGNVIWQKTYGGPGFDYGAAGVALPGGGFIVVGSTESFGSGDDDLWCLRLDAAGGILWQNIYGTAGGEERGYLVRSTHDGGFVFAGSTQTGGGGGIWCVKTNASGAVDWQMGYGGVFMGWPSDLLRTDDGGYVLSALAGGALLDSYILKLSASGAVTWQTFVPQASPAYPILEGIRQTSDGGYAVAGHLRVGSSDQAWYVELDSNGAFVWQKSLAGTGSAEAVGVRPTAQGGLLFVGESWVSGRNNILISHHSSTGDIDATCNMQPTSIAAGPGSLTAAATAAVATPSNATVLTPSVSPVVTAAIQVPLCWAPSAPDVTGSWSNIRYRRSKLNATLNCTNAGAAAAGSFSAKMYFSKNPTLKRRARPFKTENVAGLAAFGSYPLACRGVPGNRDKYIIAVVDAANSVAEDDEANNTIVYRFR